MAPPADQAVQVALQLANSRTSSSSTQKAAPEAQRRVDPMLGDRAVTFQEMRVGLADQQLSTEQLLIHWSNLQPAKAVDDDLHVSEEGTHGRSMPGGVRFNEEIQDALDTQGASDELVDDFAMRENQALLLRGKSDDSPVQLPNSVRMMALDFLSNLVAATGLTQKNWFVTVALLDVVVSRSKEEEVIDKLPATCAALVMLQRKDDSAIMAVGGAAFVPHATQFAKYLALLGFNVRPEVTEDVIVAQENLILQVTGWRLHLPTMESWTTLFATRFNVMSWQLLGPSLNWVWQQCCMASHLVVKHQAATRTRPPRKLAAGLLGLGLVGARLIQLEAIQPPKLSAEEWEQLYQTTFPTCEQPQCMLQAGQSGVLLNLLLVTVKSSLEEVQEYCHLAALALLERMNDAQETKLGASTERAVEQAKHQTAVPTPPASNSNINAVGQVRHACV